MSRTFNNIDQLVDELKIDLTAAVVAWASKSIRLTLGPELKEGIHTYQVVSFRDSLQPVITAGPIPAKLVIGIDGVVLVNAINNMPLNKQASASELMVFFLNSVIGNELSFCINQFKPRYVYGANEYSLLSEDSTTYEVIDSIKKSTTHMTPDNRVLLQSYNLLALYNVWLKKQNKNDNTGVLRNLLDPDGPFDIYRDLYNFVGLCPTLQINEGVLTLDDDNMHPFKTPNQGDVLLKLNFPGVGKAYPTWTNLAGVEVTLTPLDALTTIVDSFLPFFDGEEAKIAYTYVHAKYCTSYVIDEYQNVTASEPIVPPNITSIMKLDNFETICKLFVVSL